MKSLVITTKKTVIILVQFYSVGHLRKDAIHLSAK